MPPLRGNGKSTEKVRSVRKPKSHLNMPANLKVSIPLQGTEQDGVHVPIVKGRRPPQFIKHLDIETKVNLANSVARQQLVKEEPPVFQTDNIVIIQTPKPKGRKRKVKVVSDFFQNSVVMENNTAVQVVTATDTKSPEKVSPGKKPTPIKKPPTRKILTRKRLADSKAQEGAKRSKVETKIDTENRDAYIKLEDNSHAVDVLVELECGLFVEPQPAPVVVQPTPVVVQPTLEVVQPQPKKTKSSVKQLQPTAEKPAPMRQPTPGRKRGPKGKQQNVQANIETPSIVDSLKNKVTETEVKTKQNKKNAPELVESRKSSVGSSPSLLRNEVTEAEVKTKQNEQNATELVESRKSSFGSSPGLLRMRNKVTESVVKTKQKQQHAPTLLEAHKSSVGSSPSLLRMRKRVTKAEVKTNQNAPELVESRQRYVVSGLSLLRNKVIEPVVKTKQNQQNAPGLVESRKSSVGSISNQSWTRDISSSSNNTCIGSVCSNDFVRINKKLPVLKLTNIDSEVMKRQNEVQEIAASAAAVEIDEDLSDSYVDSDSVKFSEQLNDSFSANSLHLSASSSSQFTQSRRKENTSDYPKGSSSDYGKAANKLSLTMEKLDQEIIKWMAPENGNINANLVKFRDKMFDILDTEFGVITHCRHLKEMLNPLKKGGSIDETCISEQVKKCYVNNDIENVLVEENALVVEKAPVIRKARIVEKAQLVEKAPVVEKSLVVEKAQVVEQAPAVEKAPDVQQAPVDENTPVVNHTRELVKDFVEPTRRPSRHLSSNSDGNISNASTKASKDVTSDDEQAAGTSYPYYDHHDDDDTLSLFAESISCFESSRMNPPIASVVVSRPHQDEEYIPKPAKENISKPAKEYISKPVKEYTPKPVKEIISKPAKEYIPKPVQEYIPKPVNEAYLPNTEKQTYCPTKIREDAEMIASKILNVCEKQNADSTSIYKQSNSTDDAESYQEFTENIDLDTRLGPPDMIKKPRLMDSYFEGLTRTRSLVFGGLCYNNLMNGCRNMFYGQCRFLHLVPTNAQIKQKLSHLDERMLIQEYLLVRNWPELRRRYGMCFVEECAQRGLTRILLEMAYDFIVRARNECEDDTRLRVNTIEVTLLHLNTVDLSICEDSLKLIIHSEQVNQTLLCDVFMATMSITQNFSRFRIVFLNLTYFMVDNDRTFNKDVVEHILERVCILPFDESIARALIQMMRLTNSDIFNNSMIGHFERQISVNKDVFEEYTSLKNQWAFSSLLASTVVSASPPPQAQAVRPDLPDPQVLAVQPDRPDPPDPHAPQAPAASPDTTNLDNMNKAAEEPLKPVITRTIGMNPAIIFSRAASSPGLSKSFANPGPSRSHYNKTETDISNDSRNDNIRKWRNRSIFRHILPPPMANQASMRGTPPTRGTMRPPMRPQMRPPQRLPFNHRQVTFKSPSNFVNRQPAPKY